MDVAVLGSIGRNHEQLARHLEVNRQNRRVRRRSLSRAGLVNSGLRREPDQQLLAASADTLDRPPRDVVRKSRGVVASQSRGPIRARAGDPRARHQASQVACDRLDFRKLGHS